MTKNLIALMVLLTLSANTFAQTKKADTVIVELAKTSRIVLTIKDRSDLPTLYTYDYQALFKDILKKIEAKDSTIIPFSVRDSTTVVKTDDDDAEWPTYSNDNEDDDSDRYENKKDKSHYRKGTWQSFNFDLGTNNYLANGKFPDVDNANYSVRPWGSWYLGLNSTQKTRIHGKFFLEWGLGVSWYNFKFQNDAIVISKDDSGVTFTEDVRDIDTKKSKLTACFVNASLVPVIDFGGSRHKARFWDGNSGFRIGVGPYVGYRIDSYSKVVYKENGDLEKDRNHSNFYLNNLRYGARLQVGFRNTDLFFNYDINELFAENRGPKLNAFSFGVIF